jgi:tetratricopeptide (TPR) repeat protein
MTVYLQPDQAITVIEQAWEDVKDANVTQARTRSEKLVQNIELYLDDNESLWLHPYALSCHVAGYSASMNSTNQEVTPALSYFQTMVETASRLQDNTLLTIALTYKGDTLRRTGKLESAINCLKTAYCLSDGVDKAAHGNCAQLLARAYFYKGEMTAFQVYMQEAEDVTQYVDSAANSVHGQYSLGTVYIEYARCYGKLEMNCEALDYLHKAERVLPESKHWQTLLTATKGILLVKSGKISEGMKYVNVSLELSKQHGNRRVLEHFRELMKFMDKKSVEITAARIELLDGFSSSFE